MYRLSIIATPRPAEEHLGYHPTVALAIAESARRDLLSRREWDVMACFSHHDPIEYIGGFAVCTVYGTNEDSFQVVVEAGQGHKIGDLTRYALELMKLE